MMAQVIKQPDRYLTTPPDIMLIPKAYIDVIKNQYNPDVFDIVKIENGSDKKGIYNIFYGHLFRELASANFIIPTKMNAKMAPPDENGKTVITEGSTMEFPTKNGKNGRDAVCMFTDWKRLRMNYKESDGWDGLIQPISGMIEKFDCAINATEYLSAGCYIDKDFYDANIK